MSATSGNRETVWAAVDRYITARMRSDRIPGVALAVVEGDQMVYLKGYGYADPSGRPVTPRTPFQIGSITKPITAMAVMHLVEAGKVELDAPVQRYIPWFRVADPSASQRITVRMLVNQTSGLPQRPTLATWTWPDEPNAIERHVRLLAGVDLVAPPGQAFTYSNANYVTLGMLIQAVSGLSYEAYVQQHILGPLEMHDSFTSQDEAIRHGMASGFRWWFGIPVPVTLPYNRANLPAGFIIASATDMAHVMIAQLNGGRYRDASVLSPEGVARMQAEPTPGAYGMGWASVRIGDLRLVHHVGGTANFQAALFLDPQARVGVYLAANVINGLDAFSSAHGESLLDGITTRNMALSVFNLVTGRPLPHQGVGIRRLTRWFNLLLLGLTGAMVAALARSPRRHRRLAQRGMAGWPDPARLAGQIALSHFSGPLALRAVARRLPEWILLVLYQPDLVAWLHAMAAAASLKGLLELALAWREFRRTHP